VFIIEKRFLIDARSFCSLKEKVGRERKRKREREREREREKERKAEVAQR